MSRQPLGVAAGLAARLAKVILLAYPPAFRRAFGTDMAGAFRDRLEEAEGRGLLSGSLAILRAIADLAGAAVLEWLRPTYAAAHGIPAEGDTRHAAGAASQTGTLMDHVIQDVRFAVRSLLRRPGFALVAVLTLALGIGATTGVFSVIDGVLLRALPYPDPSSLVMVWSSGTEGEAHRGYMSQPDIGSARELKSVVSLEGVSHGAYTLTGVDHPERVEAARVTGGLLSIFGFAPELGRDLREAENDPGAPRVVVVSHDFWKRRLSGLADVVGTTLELSEQRYEIVGVAPQGFDFPTGAQLWTPYRLDPDGCGRGCHVFGGAVGRLGPGTNLEQAQEALTAVAAALRQQFPDSNYGETLRFERLIDYMVGDVRTGLWIVLGAVSLVLLIVCANMANLLLVRASTRSGEVAVRSALGASRGRLILQVLTESLVLAAVGGGTGVLVAFGLVEGLGRVAYDTIPRLDQVSVNGTVLAFAAGLSLIVSLLFGLSPALSLARSSTAGQLSAAGRSGDARREGRARSLLLAAEVALSLALLTGAGLLMRSLGQLYSVDRGFDGRQVSRFNVSLPSPRYDSIASVMTFLDQLEGRLKATPGVEEVGSSFGAPMTRGSVSGSVSVEGRPEPGPAQETEAWVRSITPGYIEAMGLRLIRGRSLEAGDNRVDSEPVALVNERFVRENFPDEEVLGKRLSVSVNVGYGTPTWTVVGVVHDVRRSLAAKAVAAVYVPVAQFGPSSLTVHIKSRAGLGSSVLAAARREVAALDPNVIPTNVQTVAEAMRADTAPTRFYLMLVGIFAGLAVVLAAIGLYGVVAYLVSRRTREIGVRMALGAKRAEIRGLVFRQTAVPTAVGVAVGLAVAQEGGRLMQSLLFQVEPTDPVVFTCVTILILAVCALAVLVPARRATQIDPVNALRSE